MNRRIEEGANDRIATAKQPDILNMLCFICNIIDAMKEQGI